MLIGIFVQEQEGSQISIPDLLFASNVLFCLKVTKEKYYFI